jgi:hypothetical protein
MFLQCHEKKGGLEVPLAIEKSHNWPLFYLNKVWASVSRSIEKRGSPLRWNLYGKGTIDMDQTDRLDLQISTAVTRPDESKKSTNDICCGFSVWGVIGNNILKREVTNPCVPLES